MTPPGLMLPGTAKACGTDGPKALCLAYIGFYNVSLGRMGDGTEQQDAQPQRDPPGH